METNDVEEGQGEIAQLGEAERTGVAEEPEVVACQ